MSLSRASRIYSFSLNLQRNKVNCDWLYSCTLGIFLFIDQCDRHIELKKIFFPKKHSIKDSEHPTGLTAQLYNIFRIHILRNLPLPTIQIRGNNKWMLEGMKWNGEHQNIMAVNKMLYTQRVINGDLVFWIGWKHWSNAQSCKEWVGCCEMLQIISRLMIWEGAAHQCAKHN